MCPPMESDSIDFECTFEGKYISCLNSVSGTILYQTCKATHTLSNKQEKLSNQLLCLEDATWSDDDLYTCIPCNSCGQLYTPSDEKIEYGTVPWNVALYQRNYSHHDEYYELICSGTLITPNLVVTFARYYWEEGNTDRILTNKYNTYKIAVGKYNSDISIKDNNFTQIIDVYLIYLKESYYGFSGYYVDDLAIIVLRTQVTISDFLLPVCIDWSNQYTVTNGSKRKVIGWGKTEMTETSSVLLKSNVSYIEKNACRDMYANGFQSLVTIDKFCAVSELGTVALCNKEFNKRQVELTCSDETEYTCKSGQCIDITSICDGLQDCTDGSDETEILCGSITCPKYAFKCKYGACINIGSKCDGVNQCLDGSDEEQCTDLIIESENTSIEESTDTESTIEESTTMEQTTESTTTEQTSKSTTTQQTTISTTTASTITNTSSSTVIALSRPKESIEDSFNQNKTCVIPTIEGTKYFYKDLIQNVPVSNGAVVDQYRIVEMDCVEGYYKTVPHKFMVCSESGQWMPKPSETLCSKKCPPMVSDKLDIKCSLNGNNVNCSMPLEPGTILTQSCKVINSNNLSREQEVMSTPNELLCLQNAQWNGQLLANCTPQEETITNRVKESSVTAPWNVEIYKINNDGHYYRICGGTLIAPNLVVSAAHCFWKKGLRRKILLNENFSTKIAVGKETTNFSVIDNKYTQFIDIKSIYLKESYDGPFGMYADDISVIVLATNIAISNGVWPASIDWSTTNLLSNGDSGKMFGLGINSNMTGMGQDKSILKLFTLPYIDRETCQKMYTNGFQYYVTRDKFCTDYKSVAGEKHLTGFGGSGLIYESNNHVPFLAGVLSIKDLHSNKPVAVFTSIAHHVQWICHIYLNHVSIV